jgi:hypothetical protein
MFMDSAPPAPAPAPVTYAGKLIQLSEDGTEHEVLNVVSDGTGIGRSLGGIFASDPYLDPDHLELHATEEGLILTRDSAVNGVFVRLYGSRELADGDHFRIGQELMVYHDLPEPQSMADGSEIMGSPNAGFWGRVTLLVEPDIGVRAWPIFDTGISMGREQGEILFPTDGYVSGAHCRIIGDDTGVYLEDLDSSNGTFFRAREGELLPFGSLILLGQHLFRIDPA